MVVRQQVNSWKAALPAPVPLAPQHVNVWKTIRRWSALWSPDVLRVSRVACWGLEGHSISDWVLSGEDSSELYLTGLLLLHTHTHWKRYGTELDMAFSQDLKKIQPWNHCPMKKVNCTLITTSITDILIAMARNSEENIKPFHINPMLPSQFLYRVSELQCFSK